MYVCMHVCMYVCIFVSRQPTVGQGLPIHKVARSHNDAPQLVALLWMRDQLVAETST
jgi:hypothetical protein